MSSGQPGLQNKTFSNSKLGVVAHTYGPSRGRSVSKIKASLVYKLQNSQSYTGKLPQKTNIKITPINDLLVVPLLRSSFVKSLKCETIRTLASPRR